MGRYGALFHAKHDECSWMDYILSYLYPNRIGMLALRLILDELMPEQIVGI